MSKCTVVTGPLVRNTLLGATLVCCAVGIPVGAATSAYEFRCTEPEGRLLIDPKVGLIEKRFRDRDDGTGRKNETISTIFVRCDYPMEGLFCVREGIDPLKGEEQTYVFSAPNALHAGTFRVEGYEFSAAPFHRGTSGRWATEIVVTPPPQFANPYTLYVEERRGLVGIRFHSLVAPVNHSRQVERRFDDVMCDAVAGRPMMFAGIRFVR